MNNVDKALETQLNNIQTKTGKTLDELFTLIRESGLAKHGEMRDMLKHDLGLGHGDANTLQFAMIGPATKTRVEVGLNMKGLEATPRLVAMPAGGMCQYKVNVTTAEEVDQELLDWIRQAYNSAG